ILLDRLIGAARPAGYLTEARSHNAVVAAVAQGRADWGLAIAPAAKLAGLGFIPCRDERYDFVVPRVRLHRPAVQAFVRLLDRPGDPGRPRRHGVLERLTHETDFDPAVCPQPESRH